MQFKWLRVCGIVSFVFVAPAVVAGLPPTGGCVLAPGLADEIAKAYPHMRPASLADLHGYASKEYRKDFGTRCPGLVKVNFYGDEKPTWALLLVAQDLTKPAKPQLVVAHRTGEVWDIRSLDEADGAVAVWSQAPGNYEEVYGQKAIRASWPVVLISDYGSYTILYAWTGKAVERIWLSD